MLKDQNIDAIVKIVTLCQQVFDDGQFRARDGKTFCNIVVSTICSIMGYSGFNSLVANEMVDKARTAYDWMRVSPAFALDCINAGWLAIAGRTGKPNGHVVVLMPGSGVRSGKWREVVPRCLNIGADYSIGEGVNWAFKDRPDYFVHIAPYAQPPAL